MPDWAGGLFLELRENAAKALNDRSWDPVTLAVADRRELLLWVRWLDVCGTRHSPVLTGLRGWLIVFEVWMSCMSFWRVRVLMLTFVSDGRRIRLYSREDHGGKEKPSYDRQWLDGS